MPKLTRDKRPDPAGWRLKQHSGKDLPHEIVWPADVCVRCRYQGQMYHSTGRPLCQACESVSVCLEAPAVGLHERREILQLEA